MPPPEHGPGKASIVRRQGKLGAAHAATASTGGQIMPPAPYFRRAGGLLLRTARLAILELFSRQANNLGKPVELRFGGFSISSHDYATPLVRGSEASHSWTSCS